MNPIHLALEEYLGDSVYAGLDGDSLVLCTKNSDECGNIIFLEPQVVEALLRYLARVSASNPTPPAPEPIPGEPHISG